MFKVGDKIVITNYSKSLLNPEDVGKIATISRIYNHPRIGTVVEFPFIQDGLLGSGTTNFASINEIRLLTPLEELL